MGKTDCVKMKQRVKRKFKIGLCLSGGGVRGFAHIGAFKAFEELGIHFDMVAGTSVGAICSMLYASGYTYDVMVERTSNIKTSDLRKSKFGFLPSRTDSLQELINDLAPVEKIEELKLPMFAVAVDIKTGEEKHFSTGDIAPIIAGSCAIPYVFYPVEYRGLRLVDGGVKNNIPADVLRANGCDYVVTIDCNCGRGKGTKSSKFTAQLKASFQIMLVNNSSQGLECSDVIICPKLTGVKVLKVDGKDAIIQEGYNAVMRSKADLEKLFAGQVKKKNL